MAPKQTQALVLGFRARTGSSAVVASPEAAESPRIVAKTRIVMARPSRPARCTTPPRSSPGGGRGARREERVGLRGPRRQGTGGAEGRAWPRASVDRVRWWPRRRSGAPPGADRGRAPRRLRCGGAVPQRRGASAASSGEDGTHPAHRAPHPCSEGGGGAPAGAGAAPGRAGEGLRAAVDEGAEGVRARRLGAARLTQPRPKRASSSVSRSVSPSRAAVVSSIRRS